MVAEGVVGPNPGTRQPRKCVRILSDRPRTLSLNARPHRFVVRARRLEQSPPVPRHAGIVTPLVGVHGASCVCGAGG